MFHPTKASTMRGRVTRGPGIGSGRPPTWTDARGTSDDELAPGVTQIDIGLGLLDTFPILVVGMLHMDAAWQTASDPTAGQGVSLVSWYLYKHGIMLSFVCDLYQI